MSEHNDLIELAENDFKDFKCFKAKIFEHSDYKDFLYFGIMLLHEAKNLREELQKPWGGYNPLQPNRFQLRRFTTLNKNLMLGIGSEYLFKTIFLKNGFGINKIKKGVNIDKPYKINESTRDYLNSSETVTFWYLRKFILQIMDTLEFDEKTAQENNENSEREKELPKLKGIKKIYYKKPNSEACLNFIQGIRNNYSHNAFIKSEFNGFFKDALNFLNFLCEKEFGKNIEEMYNTYKPE